MATPARPSTSTAKGRNPPRRKFKQSCTECAAAKVKCGKETPTCSRCVARNLRCGHDLSHRAGRRRASPPKTGTITPASSTASAPHRSSVDRPLSPFECPTSSTATIDFSMLHTSAMDAIDADLGFFSDPFEHTNIGLDGGEWLNISPLQATSAPSHDPLIEFDLGRPTPVDYGFSDHQFYNADRAGLASAVGPSADSSLTTCDTRSSYHQTLLETPSSDVRTPVVPDAGSASHMKALMGTVDETTGLCDAVASGKDSCRTQLLKLLSAQEASRSQLSQPINQLRVLESGVSQVGVTNTHSSSRILLFNRTALDIANEVLNCQCTVSNNELLCLVVLTILQQEVMRSYATFASSREEPATPQIPVRTAETMVMGGEDERTRTTRATQVFGELHRVLQVVEALGRRTGKGRQDSMAPQDAEASSEAHSMATIRNIPPQLGPDGNDSSAAARSDDDLSPLTLQVLEFESQRRFVRLKDEIRAILRR